MKQEPVELPSGGGTAGVRGALGGNSIGEALGRIGRFTIRRYKPHYLVYAVLWTLAVEGTAAIVAQPDLAWRPGVATWVRVGVVAVVLLFLRMVDECKDLDYDRVHHPDRPLVTGAIRPAELWGAMLVIAVGVLAASAALSMGSALAIAAVLAYGLGLWAVERASTRIRTHLVLNLIVTFPVQLVLTAYVLVSARDTGQVAAGGPVWLVAVIVVGAFLQFEFARKTARPTEETPQQAVAKPLGETGRPEYYSEVLGVGPAVAAGLLCAAAAVAGDLQAVQPWTHTGARALIGWLPPVLLALPLFGAIRFARSRAPSYPVVPALLFAFLLYPVLIAQAAFTG